MGFPDAPVRRFWNSLSHYPKNCTNYYCIYFQLKYIQRLKAIRTTLLQSEFFRTHEVIGSSLLFVHDKNNASIWLIDFAKTNPLPSEVSISHFNEWVVGNHEDGYLIGINNLIEMFEEVKELDTLRTSDFPFNIKRIESGKRSHNIESTESCTEQKTSENG